MNRPALLPALAAMLAAPNRAACRDIASGATPQELAHALTHFTASHHWRLHMMLTRQQRADTYPLLDEDRRSALERLMTHDRGASESSGATRAQVKEQERETTEDFHKLGGTLAMGAMSISRATLGALYRKRIVWLVLLVFGNLFSGAALESFQDTLARFLPLVFFLPLLIDSGGNAGSQSATIMVRALATGDVVLKDWSRLLLREVTVALMLGGTMAAAVGLLGVWRTDHLIAMVVASSMVIVVLLGCVVGLTLPFIFSICKLDPASASAPLVTSVVDAVGVLVYLSIAVLILGDASAIS